MAIVLVTGMSGVGKSTVLALLAARGHAAVDTDVGGWTEDVAGPGDDEPDHRWREVPMRELLTAARDNPDRSLFVGGCVSNQGSFRSQFDAVVLLSAPLDVMLARVAARTDNPYGKSEADRELIRRHTQLVEPLLRASATVEIDARRPPDDIAAELERLITAP